VISLVVMQKLDDHEVHTALIHASDALPNVKDCESVAAQTAVSAARQALVSLQLGLLFIAEPPQKPLEPPHSD
jgi:hypothetical protein